VSVEPNVRGSAAIVAPLDLLVFRCVSAADVLGGSSRPYPSPRFGCGQSVDSAERRLDSESLGIGRRIAHRKKLQQCKNTVKFDIDVTPARTFGNLHKSVSPKFAFPVDPQSFKMFGRLQTYGQIKRLDFNQAE
jgi:hypothetical protein